MVYEIVIGRNASDRQKFGTKGTIFLGKQYIKMGQTTSLSNPVYLDVSSSHVFFVVGKRGSGKCLHGDTLITLSDGRIALIKELAKDDSGIICLDDNLKMNTSEKTDFFRRKVSKLLNIKLRSGKEIKLTPEHPLLSIEGWIPAEKMKIGERIATPRVEPVFGEKEMKEEKVKLLAYFIAEGHLNNNFMLFCNADEKIVDEFKHCVNGFDDELVVKEHGKYNYRVIGSWKNIANLEYVSRDDRGRFIRPPLVNRKNSLREFFEEQGIYGTKSGQRFIPDSICMLPKRQLALFLNRLFSCDGSLYKKKTKTGGFWQVSYCSKSYKMIRQVQSLLLRFGIKSKVRPKILGEFLNHELEIHAADTYVYLQEIGFYGEKEERMAILESPKKRNPNIDTIPKEIWQKYRPENWTEIGHALGYKQPKAMREGMRYAPSRQKLVKIAVADEREDMMKIAESDIFWDEIISMEEIEGEFEVFDLTVPDNHNFVANDIIVHNSYTMGVMAEGMADLPPEIKQNVAVVMLDTMGIYWTMKYPNHKDYDLLKEWKLEAKPLDIQIYTPSGFYKEYKEKGIPTDFPFAIKPSELAPIDWCSTFEIDPLTSVGTYIERVMTDINDEMDDFDLKDVMKYIEKDDAAKDLKDAALNKFEIASKWGIFDKEGTKLADIVKGGQITVLDVSCYVTTAGAAGVRALVIGLIAQKLFLERMIARTGEEYQSVSESVHYFSREQKKKKEMPLVWLIIDEAHEFLPREGKTAASQPLITILREGRQPGISLILASQQPGKIHTDVMTQSDTVISHRLTAKVDVEALGMLMQSYMREGLDKAIDNLPRTKGSAVIFDDTNERLYPMRIRPRFTWHGGASPSALKEAKKVFEL